MNEEEQEREVELRVRERLADERMKRMDQQWVLFNARGT
jgi:hypothetical protein